MNSQIQEKRLQQRAKAIKLAIFDVDGVLTDGRLYFLVDGSEFKTFNTLDGQGIKMLIASGVRTAIISGRSTPIVERRAQNLGIQHLYQGREDKLVVLDELLAELGLDYAEVAAAAKVRRVSFASLSCAPKATLTPPKRPTCSADHAEETTPTPDTRNAGCPAWRSRLLEHSPGKLCPANIQRH